MISIILMIHYRNSNDFYEKTYCYSKNIVYLCAVKKCGEI